MLSLPGLDADGSRELKYFLVVWAIASRARILIPGVTAGSRIAGAHPAQHASDGLLSQATCFSAGGTSACGQQAKHGIRRASAMCRAIDEPHCDVFDGSAPWASAQQIRHAEVKNGGEKWQQSAK